jgi:hypothetical protein
MKDISNIIYNCYDIGVNAQISKLEKLFDQYQDTKGPPSIKIAKPMFNLLNKLDIQDAGIDQIRPLIKMLLKY